MSNKTLVISIVVILLVFAGVVAFFRYRSDNTVSGTEPVVTDEMLNPTPVDTQPTPTADTATSTPVAVGGCTRDFSQTKLTNNKVNILNRIAEINVKGFGKIQLEFFDKDAPKTVENFLRLTDSGYYNCLTFHRVAKGFVIQGGDPSGNGSGGVSAFGEKFADELNPETASYKTGYVKGVLAMANAGPNTNGSQFFILLGDQTSWMPHNYTIFGKVKAGQDVVDKIGELQTNPPGDGAPVTPVVMESVKIIK